MRIIGIVRVSRVISRIHDAGVQDAGAASFYAL